MENLLSNVNKKGNFTDKRIIFFHRLALTNFISLLIITVRLQTYEGRAVSRKITAVKTAYELRHIA
jgi:hypothetical protein